MPRTHPTLDELRAELAKGAIIEAPISHASQHVAGYCDHETGAVVLNPRPELCDSLLHELLHRMRPRMGEKRVRAEVTYLMRRMSDEDVADLYRRYQRRAHKIAQTVILKD